MGKQHQYALCVKNRGYSESLEVRKLYRILPDAQAERRRMVRIVDESGEDYLYPSGWFVPIQLPKDVARVFSRRSA
jgi:hypothetical protein